ncbi:MAG: phospholipase D family protein [Nitrospirota bacterium]
MPQRHVRHASTWRRHRTLGRAAVPAIALAALVLSACASLPADYPRTESSALTETNDTLLGAALAPLVAAHPGESGFTPLSRGLDAFVARIVLAEAAQKSLDVQYYIWHGDTTGRLLSGALVRAADRGVRVRVLLDDLGTAADDGTLVALDAHPHIEIRLFNPVALRTARGLGTVLEFGRVNRRMHNKSFTADNQATIVGGRNVGDEYFEARADLDFGDLDALTIGPVVREVSSAFDLYWNNAASFPITALTREGIASEDLTRLRDELRAYGESQKDSPYARALRSSPLAAQLRQGEVPLFWGRAWLVYDDPAKITTATTDTSTHLTPKLRDVITRTQRELLIISPYFVPGKEGVELFRSLRARGVQVRILTNSLASTDVSAVHAGYVRYRERLLRAGVQLYEVKATARIHGTDRKADKKDKGGLTGSSRASLHAKSFAFDRREIFIGSMNLDPRSMELNTEIGVLFETPEGGDLFAEGFERIVSENAFRLELTEAGRLEWVSQEDGRETRFTTEPNSSVWRRMGVWFMQWMPIEHQL